MVSDLTKRLAAAKQRARELEQEIQGFIDSHPKLSVRQLEQDSRFKRLLTLADNADRVVSQLESKKRKRR